MKPRCFIPGGAAALVAAGVWQVLCFTQFRWMHAGKSNGEAFNASRLGGRTILG